jgi:hypothetical protein
VRSKPDHVVGRKQAIEIIAQPFFESVAIHLVLSGANSTPPKSMPASAE